MATTLNKKREILIRIYVGFLVITLLGVAIIFKAGYTQIVKGNYYRSLADSLTIFPKTIAAERGNIYSTDGKLLATSMPIFDLYIDFGADGLKDEIFKKNVDSVCLLLAVKYPEKSFEDYKRIFVTNRQKKNGYFTLRKNASFQEVLTMKQWPWFRLSRNKSGLIIETKEKRDHPFGDIALRTLGTDENLDGIYSSGIELKYQSALAGIEGVKLYRKLSGGASKPLDANDDIAAKPGRDIYTTIDINYQDVAHAALRRALIEHKADHGTVVLMEVKSGKIRAIANLGRKDSTNYKELLNYAVGESAEPGSTFKIATLAALLEDGIANSNTKTPIGNGTFTLKGLTIKDHDAPESPSLTLKRAIEVSSNVAIAKLAYNNYAVKQSQFYNHLKNYGFTEPINIEVSGKVVPTIALPKKWSGVSSAYIAHGYEVKITPLHTLQFINAIANNGVLVKPTLIEKIGEYNVALDTFANENSRKIMDEKYAKEIQTILQGVVENGTARNLKTDYLSIAGKTGTAVIANKGYKGAKKYQASFVGYFPAENPQFSMIVVVNSPSNGVYYGNVVAGSIFREVADKVYSLSIKMQLPINVPVAKPQLPSFANSSSKSIEKTYSFFGINSENINDEWIAASISNNKIQYSSNEVLANRVPNVKGMGLRDAVFLLESKGLVVDFSGNGNVKNQSIEAGSIFRKGQKITIELMQ